MWLSELLMRLIIQKFVMLSEHFIDLLELLIKLSVGKCMWLSKLLIRSSVGKFMYMIVKNLDELLKCLIGLSVETLLGLSVEKFMSLLV